MSRFTLLVVLLFTSIVMELYAQNRSEWTIQLSGEINDSFIFSNLEYGRIDNDSVQIAKDATLGIFSVPLSTVPGNLEIAALIANVVGIAIEPGVYTMVTVENESPILQQLPKQGFMTLVRTNRGISVDEYYSVSGTITVNTTDPVRLTAEMNVTLENEQGKQIQASGNVVLFY